MLESLTFLLSYGTARRKEGPPPSQQGETQASSALGSQEAKGQGLTLGSRAHGLASGLQPIGWRVFQAAQEAFYLLSPKTSAQEAPEPQACHPAGVAKGRQPLTGAGKGRHARQKEGLQLPLCFSLSPGARDPLSKDVSEDAHPGQRQPPTLGNLYRPVAAQ